MIHIDLSNTQQFLQANYDTALSPRLHIAHEHLQKGNGLGGNFTGWVHLPADYDRDEVARIKKAAKKIQSDSQALVVIGIGGSYLGARGVIECLCSPQLQSQKEKYTQHLLHRQRPILRGIERNHGSVERRGFFCQRNLQVRHYYRACRSVPFLPPYAGREVRQE